jgi:flagellar basal body-associated protein FliL
MEESATSELFKPELLLNKMAIEDHRGIPENDHPSDHSVSTSDDGTEHSPEMQSKIRSKESSQILYLRIIVTIVLLLAASLTAYAIFKITRSAEKDQFENQFNDHSIKVIDAFEANIFNTIGALDNMAVSITSFAQTTSATWPMVVPPQFEISGASSRRLANADLVTFLPLVTSTSRLEWEEFSVSNLEWIEKGLEREEISGSGNTHDDHRSRRVLLSRHEEELLEDPHVYPNITADGVSDAIFFIEPLHHVTIIEQSDGPFFPIWQTTPVNQDLVNYNLLSHATLGLDLKIACDTEQIVFGRIAEIFDVHDPFYFLYKEFDIFEKGEKIDHDNHDNSLEEEDDEDHDDEEALHLDENEDHDDEEALHLDGDEDHDDEDEDHDDEDEDHDDEDEDHDDEDALAHERGEHIGHLGDPFSMAIFPVFDGFEEPRELVGFVSAVLYWSDFFRNILPPGTEPIILVMDNSCGDSFTLEVHGEAAEVLAKEDLHEHRFDDLEVPYNFQRIVERSQGGGLTYSGVGLNANYCPYSLRFYPSTEMEDFYYTRQPIIYASIVCLTFLFTAAIFVIYDFLVEKRQKKLSREAKETSAVVNALFPAMVRERMFQNDNAGKGSATDAFRSGAAQNANKGSAP